MRWCCLYCKQEDYFLPVDSTFGETKGCSVLPLEVIMRGMSQGTVMYKVRSPDRWYRRKYQVDIQNMRLSYSPSSKGFWRGKSTITDLYDIEDVRKGWNTDVFNRLEAKFRRHLQATFHPQMRAMLREENCFSLIVGSGHSVIDLIAPNVHTRDAWVRGLGHLVATCKSAQKKQEYNRWLKDQVRKADVNNNGSLNFNECLLLLNQLNISMNKKEVRRLFNDSNYRKSQIDGEDALDPEEFVRFFHGLTRRPELEELMKKYSVSKTTIFAAEELRNFLLKEQKVNASTEDCEIMVDKFEPQKDRLPGYMSLKGFQEMLLSVDHDIFNKKHRIIYQDMTHPLSHYFIASSHNTYLIHGQLIGNSSVEGYIKALTRGCRCLELDTWDGPDGEPIVFHGYTLTSRILFRDILDSVKQYAFRYSQYPVILSLENHCSIPQQKKMAEHLITILGEYLYKDPVGEHETEFPPLEVMARKILVKAKKLKAEHEEEIILEEEQEQEQAMAAAKLAESAPIPDVSLPQAPSLAAPAYSQRLAEELSDIVNYCSAVRFTNFEDCKKTWKFYEMASFQETTALSLFAEYGKEFVGYNKTHLSRIYPKGTRTDSSNCDPILYWNFGCQIVALNYQTVDFPMFINESKFAQNGRCGYILKPQFLYDQKIVYEPHAKPDPTYLRHVLIRIISGQHIPKPGNVKEGEVVDPYVTIKVAGHPLDVQKKKTSYIHDNGFNPVWNEMFMLTLHLPELAMIIFSVKDQNLTGRNELLGQFALPYTSVTEGFRHIHLQDAKGQTLLPATLFVHITIGTYDTAQMSQKR